MMATQFYTASAIRVKFTLHEIKYSLKREEFECFLAIPAHSHALLKLPDISQDKNISEQSPSLLKQQ